MSVCRLLVVLFCVAVTSIQSKANPKGDKSNVVSMKRALKCESILMVPNPERAAKNLERLQKLMGDTEQWGDFTTLRESTPAALAVLGLGTETIQELQKLQIHTFDRMKQSESPKMLPGLLKVLSLVAVTGLNKPLSKKRIRYLELSDEASVEWVMKGEEPEMGFTWPQQDNLRIFLSVKAMPPLEDETDADLDELGWETDYTLGIDVPCDRAKSYTTLPNPERIRVGSEVRCRIPVVRFKGVQFHSRRQLGIVR